MKVSVSSFWMLALLASNLLLAEPSAKPVRPKLGGDQALIDKVYPPLSPELVQATANLKKLLPPNETNGSPLAGPGLPESLGIEDFVKLIQLREAVEDRGATVSTEEWRARKESYQKQMSNLRTQVGAESFGLWLSFSEQMFARRITELEKERGKNGITEQEIKRLDAMLAIARKINRSENGKPSLFGRHDAEAHDSARDGSFGYKK